jgi:SAM-dependent methyltransferase
MDALSFGPESLDLIWSEGAIYNIGFKKGAYYWGQFLKPGGVLAVSEITWLTDQRPAEVEAYWHSFYPEIATLDKKTAILEELGFEIIDTIIFPESCWEEEYYQSLEGRYDNFLARHQDNELAARVVAADREEIKMYRKYKSYYSYTFYIARKK